MTKMMNGDQYKGLEKYGLRGVDALSNATPHESGRTAGAWKFRVIPSKSHPRIEWYNTHIHNGQIIAVLIQYGHGTGTGGYVLGRDYINPALRPIFDQIAADVWKQVTA